VHNFSVSVDGFGAGPGQDVEHPLGVGGQRLHDWVFETQFGRTMIGESGGETGVDNDFFAAGDEGIGATIMGRNIFGPVRGPWGDDRWRGWWGEDPPYHHRVFVLTHHAHDPIEMEGGTTFHFVTDGIERALARAVDAADGRDVRVGGGVSVVNQYVRAGLLDELHLAIAPTLLGSGERIFDGIDLVDSGYRCIESTASRAVFHVRLVRTG
jgi:dihydrofolate reductase